MILARYILRNFAAYFICINSGLTLLHATIECFEKIAHAKQHGLAAIGKFVALGSLPNFFSLFALSSWLACCLLLRDITTRQQLITLASLGVQPKYIVYPFIVAGLITSTGQFIGDELLGTYLAHQATMFNRSVFKQQSLEQHHNYWSQLNQQQYAHFTLLDQKKASTQSITILSFDEHGALRKQLFAPTGILDYDRKTITLQDAILNVSTSLTQHQLNAITMHAPILFETLAIQQAPQSLHVLARDARTRTSCTCLLERLCSPWKNFLLCTLSILLFLWCTNAQYLRLRWIVLIALYPLLLCTSLLNSLVTVHGATPLLLLTPYATLFVLAFLIFTRIAINQTL